MLQTDSSLTDGKTEQRYGEVWAVWEEWVVWECNTIPQPEHSKYKNSTKLEPSEINFWGFFCAISIFNE